MSIALDSYQTMFNTSTQFLYKSVDRINKNATKIINYT